MSTEPSCSENRSKGIRFLKQWFRRHKVAYRCVFSFHARRRVFKCQLSASCALHSAKGQSTNRRAAKIAAAVKYCAFLVSISVIELDQLPTKFRNYCEDILKKHEQKFKKDHILLDKSVPAVGHCVLPENGKENVINGAVDGVACMENAIIDLTKEENEMVCSDPVAPCTNGTQENRPDVDSSIGLTPLSNEIVRFYECNVQPRYEFINKLKVVDQLEAYIRQHAFTDLELFLVGSSASGLGTSGCDMDLCLVCLKTARVECGEKALAMRTLRKIMKHLRRPKSPVHNVMLIPARVPIIRCCFRKFKIDINWNNIPSMYNTHLLHYYAQVDRRFPMMVVVIKRWAYHVGILDAREGFLNSYSWVLLVIHFLQCGTSPMLPVLPNLQALFPDTFSFNRPIEELGFYHNLPASARSENQQEVGELLTNFFGYYACFKFCHFTISVRTARIYPRRPDSYFISIEEPYDGMNTARSLRLQKNFLKIQYHIRQAYRKLRQHARLASLFE